MSNIIKEQASSAIFELCRIARLSEGSLVVVGCSSSEITGNKVGSNPNPVIARDVFEGIWEVLRSKNIFFAAQCCEHLNRALIVERSLLKTGSYEQVNVIPQPKAGGSFATAAYQLFSDPVAVEKIKADAGLDIGGTLIGMHLKEVAVPVRLSINRIGEASLIAARTRLKFVGGIRAIYDETLL